MVHDGSPSQCCSSATACSSRTRPAPTSAPLGADGRDARVCWAAVPFAAEHLRHSGIRVEG